MLRHKRNVHMKEKYIVPLPPVVKSTNMTFKHPFSMVVSGPSGAKYRHLKEMEKEQIEKQRPVVNLVSPVAQATEMARSEIKREREMAKSKPFVPPGRRQNVNRSITKDYF